jgi:hypothetical protein
VDSPVWPAAYDAASGQLVLYGGDAGIGGSFSNGTRVHLDTYMVASGRRATAETNVTSSGN